MSYPLPPSNAFNPNIQDASEQNRKRLESPTLIVVLNVVNALTQLLIGAVVFSAFSFANVITFPRSLWTHIYLCVIGYVILMSQAILSFNSHAGWAYSLKYADKRMVHGVMQILGSSLAIIGSIIRIADTNYHFRSGHSIAGIIALILTTLSLIGGILNFVFPSKTNSVLSKNMHIAIGSLSISMAFICLCFAFNNWYKALWSGINGNFAIVCTVFALVGILISGSYRTVQRTIR